MARRRRRPDDRGAGRREPPDPPDPPPPEDRAGAPPFDFAQDRSAESDDLERELAEIEDSTDMDLVLDDSTDDGLPAIDLSARARRATAARGALPPAPLDDPTSEIDDVPGLLSEDDLAAPSGSHDALEASTELDEDDDDDESSPARRRRGLGSSDPDNDPFRESDPDYAGAATELFRPGTARPRRFRIPPATDSLRAERVAADESSAEDIPEPTESLRVPSIDPDEDASDSDADAGFDLADRLAAAPRGPSGDLPVVFLQDSEDARRAMSRSVDELTIRPSHDESEGDDLSSDDARDSDVDAGYLDPSFHGRRTEAFPIPDASESLRVAPPSDDEGSDVRIPEPTESLRAPSIDPDADDAPAFDEDDGESASSRMPIAILPASDDAAEQRRKRRLSADEVVGERESRGARTAGSRKGAKAQRSETARGRVVGGGAAGGDADADELARLRALVKKLKKENRALEKRIAELERDAELAGTERKQVGREVAAARRERDAAVGRSRRRLLAAVLLPPLLAVLAAGGVAAYLIQQNNAALTAATGDAQAELEGRLASERAKGREEGRREGVAQGRELARTDADAAAERARAQERAAAEAAVEAERARARDAAERAAEAARTDERRAVEERLQAAREEAEQQRRRAEQNARMLALARASKKEADRAAAERLAEERAREEKARAEALREQREELDRAHQAELEALAQELSRLAARPGASGEGLGGSAAEDDPFAAFDEPEGGGEADPFAVFDQEGGFAEDGFEAAFDGQTQDFLQKAYAFYRERFRTTLEYKVFAHFAHGAQDDRTIRNEFVGKVELNDSLDFIDEDLRVVAIARAWADDNGLAAGAQESIKDDQDRRYTFGVEEAFLAYRLADFDVRAGAIIYAWGTADLFNPTDNLNPRDLSDLIDSEKIAVPSAELTWSPGPIVLELVAIPTYTPTRLARQGKRFSFIPAGTPPIILGADEPSNTFANVQGAARISTTIAGFDLSASYFDGYNDIPSARIRLIGAIPFIEPVFDRIRVAGFDFATAIDRFQIHGEAAYFQTEGDRDDDYIQYVVGGETTFNDVIFEHDIRIILEYIGETVVRDEDDGVFDSQVGRALTNAVGGRLVYELSAFVRFEATGVIILDGPDNGFAEVSAEWDATDNLTLTVGYDVIAGNRDSFFGQFKDEDRVFGRIKFSF